MSNALEVVQNLVFLAVGVWSAARWRRDGNEQGRWLAATFLALGAVVAVGLVTRLLGAELPTIVTRGLVVLLALFPYLLVRFLDSFDRVSRWHLRVVSVGTGVIAVTGVFLQDFEEEGPLLLAYTFVFVAVWLYALASVARGFWRAGRGQPSLVRRRLRTLSLAAATLGLTLFVSASLPTEDPGPASIAVQLLALIAAGSFALGFTPPAVLRSWWRQPEEHRLHEASVQLMSATAPQEVADLLAPRVRDVIGAGAAAVVHRGTVLATVGLDDQQRRALQHGTADGTTYELHDGALHVWTNAYTPFFGEGEMELLARLAVLADLALARTVLLASEQRARIELEAANAELESFIYSASHDLKSPLIAIQSYLDILEEEFGDALTDDGRWYLERMDSNAAYMEALVKDLLSLSRVGRVDTTPEVVPLAVMLAEVAAEVEERHEHARITVEDGLPSLWMNPVRCRQLFRNLIENAATHGADSEDGLHVSVSAAELSDGGGVEVLVRDDGPGVPAEFRERVFGVFERLEASDEASDGTGIGLAICRKIVEAVGGRIWITDHEGGAEFAIRLPPSAVADAVPSSEATQEVPA